MGRSANEVPERIAWAVDLLQVAPEDRILELGCGPGVAVSLICDLLDGGHVTAIDRSATAIERAKARNGGHMEAGRVTLHQADLAGFRGQRAQFDKAFAVNVNVFWTTEAEPECEALAHVLAPAGVLHLVYAGPDRDGRDVGPKVAAKLTRHGFAATVTRNETGSMTCITGRRLQG